MWVLYALGLFLTDTCAHGRFQLLDGDAKMKIYGNPPHAVTCLAVTAPQHRVDTTKRQRFP